MSSTLNPVRALWSRLLTALALLALAACEPIDFRGLGDRLNPDRAVPVALLVPRGSGNAGDEVLAESLENAARLAVAELEGAKVDLRVYNTAADPETGATQARLAVRDGAKIIIGPMYSEVANAVGVAVASNNVNVLSFSNNTTIAGGNVFILGHTFQNTAQRLMNFAASRGNSRVVVVHATDVAGQLGRNAIQQAAVGSGAEVVGTVSYELSQESVAAAVPRIKSAVDGANADTIFMTSTSSGALPLYAGLLPGAGLPPGRVQYVGLTRWDIPSQTLNFPGLQGGLFALPDPNRVAAFNSRYESSYGRPPHPIGALAFDGIAAVGGLIAQGETNALTREALTQANGFQGASGAFRLKADGSNDRAIAVATVRDNQTAILDPAQRNFAGF